MKDANYQPEGISQEMIKDKVYQYFNSSSSDNEDYHEGNPEQ